MMVFHSSAALDVATFESPGAACFPGWEVSVDPVSDAPHPVARRAARIVVETAREIGRASMRGHSTDPAGALSMLGTTRGLAGGDIAGGVLGQRATSRRKSVTKARNPSAESTLER